ncbi:MAG: chemotaxis protein CheC [Nanoarchaeota archaeon]
MVEKSLEKELNNDIVREVGNILSNHTATAFSQMIEDDFNIKSKVMMISLNDFSMEVILTKEFSKVFSEVNESHITGYFLQTKAGIEGVSVLLFTDEHAEKLVNTVADNMGTGASSDEDRKEILKEFSSIAMNAYLTALSNLIETKIVATTPIPASDLLAALYDFKEHMSEGNKEEALMIKTDIVARETGITGKLSILLEPDSFKKIVSILRDKSGV